MEGNDFSEKVAEVARMIRVDRDVEASAYIQPVLVQRLVSETQETLGTPGETDPDTAFANVVDEFALELVIAIADQTGASCQHVVKTVDRFISAHVNHLKESIISDVESNLVWPAGSPRASRQADNDTV